LSYADKTKTAFIIATMRMRCRKLANSTAVYRHLPLLYRRVAVSLRPMNLPAGLKLHKATGQYRAWLRGSYRYFGKEPAEAIRRYGLAIAEAPSDAPLVADVVEAIQEWADKRYPPSGRWGGSAKVLKAALRFLDTTVVVRTRNGPPQEVSLPALPADQFTCLHLAAVRQQMMDDGLKRGYINAQIRRIQQGFKEMRPLGLVTAATVADLQSLSPLPRGHAGVKDNPPIGPASDADLEAVLPFMSPQMAAIARVLRITGMRVGECLAMRVSMLETSGEVWVYDLGMNHKGRNSGKPKRIYLGPKAQAALRPWLDAAKATMVTTAPLWPAMSIRNTSDTVSVSSVRDALEAACEAAKVPQFTTHQIRHGTATAIAEREALKAVQAALGHQSQGSSRVYAELDSIAMAHALLTG
jgi:integrase